MAWQSLAVAGEGEQWSAGSSARTSLKLFPYSWQVSLRSRRGNTALNATVRSSVRSGSRRSSEPGRLSHEREVCAVHSVLFIFWGQLVVNPGRKVVVSSQASFPSALNSI